MPISQRAKSREMPAGGVGTHTPLLPQVEVTSNMQAVALFLPMATKYLARHLTVGALIRLRRSWLRRIGGTYYL